MNQTKKIIKTIWKYDGDYIIPWDLNVNNQFKTINKIENFISNCCKQMKLEIEYMDNGARYYPNEDKIGLPPAYCFKNQYEYYRIIFHELAHSTGCTQRCNRINYNDDSIEELIAEINATMLMNYFNINNKFSKHNSAVYCQGWFYDFVNNHENNWFNLLDIINEDVIMSYNYLLKIGGQKNKMISLISCTILYGLVSLIAKC